MILKYTNIWVISLRNLFSSPDHAVTIITEMSIVKHWVLNGNIRMEFQW